MTTWTVEFYLTERGEFEVEAESEEEARNKAWDMDLSMYVRRSDMNMDVYEA